MSAKASVNTFSDEGKRTGHPHQRLMTVCCLPMLLVRGVHQH